ncbi:MAG TPA: radical SAM protein [Bacteroidia bacterium]|nr:radical SAM protein [Bacteroidia bacterium]
MARKVLLFNPRSANSKPRIPNSVLNIAASIEGKYEYVIVDGNLENDPLSKINSYLAGGDIGYFGCTVMPGPQLKQAIPFTKKIKETFPGIKIIWGGYFASNHSKTVINSGFVDVVVYGPGDKAFPALIDAFQAKSSLHSISNLIFKDGDEIIKTAKDELYDQDTLLPLPYDRLNLFYPLYKYLGNTYLGTKTIAYHSSVGCPFACSFCAVVPIYNARWKAKSAEHVYTDIKYLKENYGGTAIEFHDNNFFVSEKRTIEFSNLIKNENMGWWGEARIDTVNSYKDSTLELMREAGCKMIFFGAETGNDEVLKKMNKGGTQSGAQIISFAKRLRKFGIVPEYSFVMGTPAETPEKVMELIDKDIAFLYKVKEANPDTEIIIYVYSPVPTEGSELFKDVLNTGFRFPEKLEDWLNPEWEKFDLHKNPLTPWLTSEMVTKIKNFETVLNGYYPTVSDIKLSSFQRKFMHTISAWRYKSGFYHYPYVIKAFQKYWLRYRQPEIEGF